MDRFSLHAYDSFFAEEEEVCPFDAALAQAEVEFSKEEIDNFLKVKDRIQQILSGEQEITVEGLKKLIEETNEQLSQI